MVRLDPGSLRHRIEFQTKTRGASDGAGGNVSETWSLARRVWGRYDPQSGREIAAGDQIVHRQLAKFTIRRRTDITADMRIVYKTRIFAINAIRDLPEEGGWRFTEIMAEEAAPS